MCLHTSRKNSCVPTEVDPQSAFLECDTSRITDVFPK